MKKFVYTLLFLIIVQFSIAQTKNETDDYRDYFEISEMNYDYVYSCSESGIPETNGTLSIKLNAKKPIADFVLRISEPHYKFENNYYPRNYHKVVGDGENEVSYSVDKVRWGTMYVLTAYYYVNDERYYIMSDIFDSTDLLLEEHQQIIREYADAPITLTETNNIRYVDKSLIIQSEYGGNLKIFSLEGLPIYSVNFEADGVVNLCDGLPNIFIVVVNFDNGKVETKKIAK